MKKADDATMVPELSEWERIDGRLRKPATTLKNNSTLSVSASTRNLEKIISSRRQ